MGVAIYGGFEQAHRQDRVRFADLTAVECVGSRWKFGFIGNEHDSSNIR